MSCMKLVVYRNSRMGGNAMSSVCFQVAIGAAFLLFATAGSVDARPSAVASSAKPAHLSKSGHNTPEVSRHPTFKEKSGSSVVTDKSAGKTGVEKSSADVLMGKKSYVEAEKELRAEIPLQEKVLRSASDKLFALKVGLIKALIARGEQKEAEAEFKKFFDSANTTFDTDMKRDKLKLEFPGLYRLLPSAGNFASWTAAARHVRFSPHIRGNYDNFDASELEATLKQSLKTIDDVYGKDSPQRLQILLDLCSLYSGQFRRAEVRALLGPITSLYGRLSSENKHFFALNLLDIVQTLMSQRQSNESSILYRAVLSAISVSNWPFDTELSQRLSNIANSLEHNHQLLEAEEVYKATMRMAEKTPGKDPVAMANQQKKLADFLAKLKKYSTAEELYRMALESEVKKFGTEGVVPSQTRVHLMKLCLDGGQQEEAKELLKGILTAADTIESPHAREYQRRLIEVSLLLTTHGELESARDVLEKSMLLGARTNTLVPREYTHCAESLARAFFAQGQSAEAVKLYDRMIKAFEDCDKGNSRDFTNLLQQVARFYLDNDMFNRALPLLKRRIELSKTADPSDNRYWLREFAEQLSRKERYADAATLYEAVIPDEIPKERDLLSQYLHDQLALMMVQAHQKKYTEARAVCTRCIDILAPYLKKTSSILKSEVDQILKEDMDKNDYNAANGTLSNLIYTDFVRGSGTDAVNALMQIAWRFASKEPERATTIMRESVELAKKIYGPADARTAQMLTRLADQLRRQGLGDEAASVTHQADTIRSNLLKP